MLRLKSKFAGAIMLVSTLFAVSCDGTDEDTMPFEEVDIVVLDSPEGEGVDPEEGEDESGNTNTGGGG